MPDTCFGNPAHDHDRWEENREPRPGNGKPDDEMSAALATGTAVSSVNVTSIKRLRRRHTARVRREIIVPNAPRLPEIFMLLQPLPLEPNPRTTPKNAKPRRPLTTPPTPNR